MKYEITIRKTDPDDTYLVTLDQDGKDIGVQSIDWSVEGRGPAVAFAQVLADTIDSVLVAEGDVVTFSPPEPDPNVLVMIERIDGAFDPVIKRFETRTEASSFVACEAREGDLAQWPGDDAHIMNVRISEERLRSQALSDFVYAKAHIVRCVGGKRVFTLSRVSPDV